MNITETAPQTVTLDETIHIHGINHFSDSALGSVEPFLTTVTPDIIAVEEYPEKFIAGQLCFAQREAFGEIPLILAHALHHAIPLALLDIDWADIEHTDDYELYTEHIDAALAEAGIDEPAYESADFREYTDINDAIAEYDPAFYQAYIAERDLAMASRLYWLATESEYTTIAAVIGLGHVDNVVDILLELDAGRVQTTPTEPPIYTPTELRDFILPIEQVVEEAGPFHTESSIQHIRERYRTLADSISP